MPADALEIDNGNPARKRANCVIDGDAVCVRRIADAGAFSPRYREDSDMLHIGSGYIVPPAQVVLICDMNSVDARAYLSRMKKGSHLVNIGPEAKSLVICAGRWSETAYLSPIAARTLMQRFEAAGR